VLPRLPASRFGASDSVVERQPREDPCRRVIVAFVSCRNVGNTWNVSASALLLAAVVANVASALVIRLRSAAWFRESAANTVPPFCTSRAALLDRRPARGAEAQVDVSIGDPRQRRLAHGRLGSLVQRRAVLVRDVERQLRLGALSKGNRGAIFLFPEWSNRVRVRARHHGRLGTFTPSART
jgi:hypothetical protein